MVRGIKFTDKRFREKDDDNLFSPLTENTIVICRDYGLMDSLAKEIINTINGNAEYNDYDCDREDIGKAKMWLSFGLQRIIDINGQRITLALEPSIIYKANSIDDIWFFECCGTDTIETLPPYEESIYPMSIYKDSEKVWNNGKDEVYKMICNGRYGGYDGSWIDLDGWHFDDRTHNCGI